MYPFAGQAKITRGIMMGEPVVFMQSFDPLYGWTFYQSTYEGCDWILLEMFCCYEDAKDYFAKMF
jgi:hypothetical protein